VTLRIYHRNYGSNFSLQPDDTPKDFQIINLGQKEYEVTLYMRPGVILTGTVTDRDGNPIAGARVSEMKSTRRFETGGNGYYELFGLPVNQGLELFVFAQDYEQQVMNPELFTFPTGEHNLDWQLGKGGSVRGTVQGYTGAEEVYVVAYCFRPADLKQLPFGHGDFTINPNYFLGSLRPGQYELRIYGRDRGASIDPYVRTAPFSITYDQDPPTTVLPTITWPGN